jgi:enterochelin esterase-like enzyme
MKSKQSLMIGFALLLALASSSYRYIAIALPASAAESPSQSNNTTNLSYQMEVYNSLAMGSRRAYGVCLPPGYEQNPNQRYPVIFLLHGGNGSPTDWFDKGAVITTLKQLYVEDKLPASIIITPDGNNLRSKSPKFDPQYFDDPHGKVSTAIGDELVKVVSSRYRIPPYPNFWALGGLSSGGWGAANLGLYHLNHFSILFSPSGYFVDDSGAENSPMYFIKSLSPQVREQLRIYLGAGAEDSLFFNQTKQFHSLLNQLQVRNEFHPFLGTHSYRHLTNSLAFVGEQFRSFAGS